jgi:hypothetical protein
MKCRSAQPELAGPDEVLVGPRWRWSPLTLILRSGPRSAVRVLGGTGQPQDAQLANLHPRPERDRQIGHVGELQRDVTAKAGVDEAGGRVGQQTKPSERRFPLQPARQVVRQGAQLQRRTQHELPGVQHERFSVDRLDQARQVVLLLRRVDVCVPRVVEHPEHAVKADIHTRWLHQCVVERVNSQSAGGDFGPKVTIGEQHATSVSARCRTAVLTNGAARDASLPMQPRRCSSMAEHQLPKLNTRVRFPSSAPYLPAQNLLNQFEHLSPCHDVVTTRSYARRPHDRADMLAVDGRGMRRRRCVSS